MTATSETPMPHGPARCRGGVVAALFLAAALLALPAVPCAAADGAQSQTTAQEQQPAQPAPTPAPVPQETPRRDNVFGTLHEGIVMETDKETGDQIIQVSPKPRAAAQGNGATDSPPLVITPEISPKITIK